MGNAGRILGLSREFEEGQPGEVNVEYGKPRKLTGTLFERLFSENTKYSIVSSSPKIFSAIHKEDFTENFYISDEELEAYAQGMLDVLTSQNIQAVTNQQEEEARISLDDIALDDRDIKLSLYRSFKSIYDKWISSSGRSTQSNPTKGYFFNNYGQDDDRTLFDHFRFINRANSDVGGQAIIDPGMLSELISSNNGKGPTESLYGMVGNILSKNNFDFWPTPANIPLTTNSLPNEEVEKMFTALDRFEKIQSGPIFNCVFIGGSSRQLKDLNNKEGGCELINNDYGDDGFDLTDVTDWPEEFNNNEDSGLVIFKVRYGQEAQNHFKSIQVDQTEFKETQESLLVIDRLANPKQGNSPSQAGKGNSMYELNLTRAYTCTVTGLGNMSIQPLMYFKLENVPMFRGTYLISDVKHKISAHNVETEFTGLRQPKVTIPIVEDPISLLDLILSEEAIEGERQRSLSQVGGSGGLDGGNFSNLSNIKVQPCELAPSAGGDVLDSSDIDGDFSGLKPLKDLLGLLESANKYDIANTPNKISTTSITNKTYDQLVPFQNLPSNDTSRVFAAGRYQVIPRTMKGIIDKSKWTYNFGPGKSGVYGKKIQEKFGEFLILEIRSKLGNYIKGNNGGSQQDLEKAIQATSQEWASIPTLKDKNGTIVGSLESPTSNRGYYVGTPPNKDYTRITIGTIANTLVKARIDYSNKKPSYIPSSYNNGSPQKCEGGITQTNNGGSQGNMGCDKGFVPFGLAGVSNNILDAKNVIVGSSSVGTLSTTTSTSGTLVSNNIYAYYNCGGKTMRWLKGKISTDQNTYNNTKTFFQVGIGTNDGYKTSDSEKNSIKEYTITIQQKFPKAKLYVLPGTYGWGNVSGVTLNQVRDYFKIYTDNGWTLLWPQSGGSDIDPKFTSSSKAHDSDNKWFKEQINLISQNKS